MGVFDYFLVRNLKDLPKVGTKQDSMDLHWKKQAAGEYDGLLFQTKCLPIRRMVMYILDKGKLYCRDHDSKVETLENFTGTIEIYYPRFELDFVKGELVNPIRYLPRE